MYHGQIEHNPLSSKSSSELGDAEAQMKIAG